ncbi:MAG TPA: hypothetical protein ENJ87_04980 [Gammaproteobacteria bacterium]|nr:hypothetical protein [Gammaproteobacteria bacterium]
MKKSYKKQLLSALVLSGVIIFSGNGFAAPSFPMEAKLKQCEMAFKKAHSGKLTVAEAAKARIEHMKLVKELLENLNKRNADVDVSTGESLTQKEIVDNFRVMGRLLEMLAIEHQAPEAQWDYAY